MTVVLVPNRSVPPAAGAAEAGRRRHRSPRRSGRLARAPVDRRPLRTGRAGAPDGGAPRRPLARHDPSAPPNDSGRCSAGCLPGRLCRALFRPRLVGRERLPDGPAIYCFNHLSWIDPFVLMATLPMRPRLMFFGPKEEDMVGRRAQPADARGRARRSRTGRGRTTCSSATRRVQPRSPPAGSS